MQDYMKVSRGMVFRYNINESIDKFNVPNIILPNGKEVPDHLQYGYRDFVVVSCNENNLFGTTCNICPISGQIDKADIPSHVHLNVFGKDVTILCEHIYTVNIPELYKYQYILSSDAMSLVDKALASQLGLVSAYPSATMSLDKIESVIQGIVNQRVSEALRSCKASEVDITDAIDRIRKGLESSLSAGLDATSVAEDQSRSDIDASSSKHVRRLTQIEKFEARYPGVTSNSSADPVSPESSSNKRSWTIDSMQEFLDDAARFTPEEMVTKYSFKDTATYSKMKYYVKQRLKNMHKVC